MKKFILSVTLFLLAVCSIFAQNDLPLRILSKPTPKLTDEQKKNPPHAQGAITLRVEFLANRQIGQVIQVSGLPFLASVAIEATQKIQFEPEIKNGNPITVHKQIQYNYWYGFFEPSQNDEKAEAVIKLAIEKLGGERYLQVKTQVSTGYFTQFREGTADLPNAFLDVIAFPDKERTEFKQLGNKIIQTNFGEKGWIYDGGTKNIREQDQKEIDGFKRTLRTSVDSLLRGVWRNQGATLSYIGRREAGIGKRNEVVKLIYSDGFGVEFEFSATDGMPMKSLYKGKDNEEAETKEEDRYAQFVEIQGVLVPFIVDHHINGKQTSRINYSNIQLNKSVPEGIFNKPADVKDLKKDLKL